MAPRQAMRSISVEQAIDEYRTYNRAQNYSSSYIASTDRNLRQFADWLAAEGRALQISQLTVEDARTFIVYQRERENLIRPGTHISPDYVQQYARGLKSWATFLEAEGFTASNIFTAWAGRAFRCESRRCFRRRRSRSSLASSTRSALRPAQFATRPHAGRLGLRLSELCNPRLMTSTLSAARSR